MRLQEEKQLVLETALQGAEIALNRLGLVKDEISQREAYRLAGEAYIRSWTTQGLLTRIKVTTRKITYSRIEIETLKNLEQKRKLK